ncbi:MULTISPECIES: hypothetical protein [Roseobacter]|uniref:hypothetical protein n=1 Tax=Roseobacter TaxID=2433 RepID=UPI001BC2DBF7|nr:MULTISPECIES: hypothetical protein [Roseobacter]GIT85727.1 hypothetical protein ROBYS_07430 [Roseobacter sp. OBYS 0001]
MIFVHIAVEIEDKTVHLGRGTGDFWVGHADWKNTAGDKRCHASIVRGDLGAARIWHSTG